MELPRQRWPGGNPYHQGTWPQGGARVPLYRGPAPPPVCGAAARPELDFGLLQRNVQRIEVEVQRVLHSLKPEEARTPYSVLRHALAALGLPSLCAVGLSMNEIPSLSQLAATEVRVTMLMECYVAARNVTTLHDLEREVVGSEGSKTYLDLGLGPLQEHPVVRKYFPAVRTVVRITTADVLQSLCTYMNKKDIKVVDEMEFLTYLAEEKSSRHEHLGVLLRNVRIYEQAIRRAKEQEEEVITKYLKQARARACHAEGQKPSILHRVSNFLDREDAGYGSKKSEGKPSSEVEPKKRSRNDLQGSVPAAPSLSSCPYPSAAEERDRLGKRSRHISCTGQNAQGDELPSWDSTWSSRQHEKSVLKRAGPLPEVLLATVLEDVTSFFNDKRLKKISKVFGAEAETFLWAICVGECLPRLKERIPVESSRKFTPEWYCRFLKQHWHLLPRQVTQAFKSRTEGKLSLSYKVPRQRLSIFLKQALLAAEHEEGFLRNIEDQIKNQFKSNVNDVGFSSATELLSCAKAEVESGTSDSFLVFSGALTPMSQGVQPLGEGSDACSRPITALAALQCLEGAPLLSDLAIWSQWELVYAPSLGSLLDFLEGEYAQGKLEVLITRRGDVLRINKSATVDGFLASVTKGSAKEMAESLVSLFAAYGGGFRIPRGLLQSYAAKGVSLFLKAKGSSESGPLTGIDNWQELATRVAASCILECLNFIPPELQVLGTEILLPAIGGESGKDGHCALLQACKTYESRSILHRVGLQLGIPEWVHDFRGQAAAFVAPNVPTNLMGRGDPDKDLPPCTSLEAELPSETQQPVIPLWTGILGAGPSVTESSGETQSANETAQCEAVIAAIRQEEFGQAGELEASQKSIFVKQNARMGRALNRLSRDLYSEDSHFVLELIQNADDNDYEPGVQPTLMFVVVNGYIFVLNNEVGFTEANIRALCDVGKSTKEGRTEYIGHKGIGFKSVFKVTDAPEIHSNGFHIKFDISVGNIGYILPTWVEPISVSAALSTEEAMLPNCSWKTCIRLPLKESLQGNGTQKLASKFDIDGSILLFLKKMQCIAVENHVTGSKYTLKKEFAGQNIVRVVHSHGSSMNWLVAGEQLSAAIRSPGVEATELVLAFPLQNGSSGDYNALYTKQKVFTFLPLREYGLKFVVQGNFTLTSSREDVDRDSIWNEWLLSNIPDLFLKATGLYKKVVDKKTQGQAMTEFLRFVPAEGEVLGFFSPLPRLIMARLRVSSFLPVEGDTECAIPCSVLRGWDSSVHTVVSADMLKGHLGLQYLDKDVQISDSLAASLGVQVYGKETLFALMASISQHTGGLDLLGLPWVRSWFVLLHDCLLHEQKINSIQDWKGLSGVEFVPLSDGTYATIGEGNLWFAARDEGKEMFRHFPALLAELRVIHPSLMGDAEDRCETENDANKVKQVLSMLGIQQVSSHQVIKTHVLTAIRSSDCLRKNPALVVEYLSFVMVHLLSNCQLCKADDFEIKTLLKDHAVILTNNGLKRIGSEPIHFSQIMGNPIQVHSFLEKTGVVWNEVDSSYLEFAQKSPRVMTVMQLRTFFKQLGVTDFLEVRRVNACDDSYSADWHCPELVAILGALCQCDGEKQKKVVSQLQKQLTALLTEIDKQWDEVFGAFQGQLMSADGGRRSETTFVKELRGYSCMKSSLTGNLQLPTLLFDRCKAVEEVLGARAPYALPELSSRGMKEALGLRTQVSLDNALNLLEEWQLSSPHVACPSQMERFYSLLWQSEGTEKDRVVEAMTSKPSIFLPQAVPGDPDQVVPGNFFSPQNVVWDDVTGAVEALHKAHNSRIHSLELTIPLKRVFPKLFGFFVEELQVKREPSFEMYLDILLQIANSSSPYEMQKQVVGIFKSLSQQLESGAVGTSTVQHWRSCFQDTKNRVFPTLSGNWVSLHESEGFICLADNALLRQEMSTCLKNVHFLLLGDDARPEGGLDQDDSAVQTDVLPLLRALNIPLLSESVGHEIEAHGQIDGRRLVCVISWSLQYMQRYLAKHWPREYDDLQNGDVLGRIKSLRCNVVQKLVYRHTLPVVEWSSQPKNSPCLLHFQKDQLYVEAAYVEDYCTVYKELSRFFLAGRADLQLANFMHLVTLTRQSGASDMELENFVAAVQGIPPLPSGVDVWSIPEVSYLGVSMLSCMPRLHPGPEGELTFPCKVEAREGVNTGDAEEYVLQSDGLIARNDRKLRRHLAPNEQQQQQTGRDGEAIVYQHLVKIYGVTKVRWVNEVAETGAPFDIVVELPDGSKLFYEVKSTLSNDKDWFEISAREWEFAQQQGEKYIIIRVQLGQRTRLLRLPNPVKLCHNKRLQLALMLQDSVVYRDTVN